MSNQNLNEQTAKAKNRNYRVLAIVLAALSLIALFLPIRTFAGGKISTHISFGLLGQMFTSSYKKWGFIPMLGDPISATTRLGSYAVFGFIVAMLAVLALSIVTIVVSVKASPESKKTAILTRISVYALTLASALYSLVITTITSYAPNVNVVVDVTTVVLTALGCIAYLILLIEKYKGGCWFYIVQFVCSFVVLTIVVLAFTHRGELISGSLDVRMVYKVFAMLFILGMTTVVGIASLCVFYPKNKKVDNAISLSIVFFQTGILFGMALLAAVADIHVRDYEIYTYVAGIVAFVQFLALILWIALSDKKAEKPVKALAENEYIEVLPYEGGPVSGIYVAEVVEEENEQSAESEAAEEAPVEEGASEEAPAEEESNEPEGPFDAFMLTLSKEQRLQFTDLYILKTVNMPEIPAYVVGGDNKKFFNKVFIYIAQYRNCIPSDLLAKMYDFSMKL